ncbi:unnamed protein product [Rangifer tarandus platyrhynchus]|uniref:Uncharacterized protein n=1 Tax=Rangifer tarandus platyrhynchus TaxID=3082113 RepID=A0ABN8XZU7_RANTA|nr:unnamed protein product [Rangifer tarandus platyrhynchus]
MRLAEQQDRPCEPGQPECGDRVYESDNEDSENLERQEVGIGSRHAHCDASLVVTDCGPAHRHPLTLSARRPPAWALQLLGCPLHPLGRPPSGRRKRGALEGSSPSAMTGCCRGVRARLP